MADAKIRDDGLNVILEIEGRSFCLPFGAAKLIAQELKVAALKCEEIAKAANIASDQAVLIRRNFPIAITNHPKIMREAIKQAEDLRLPGQKEANVRPKQIKLIH